MRGIKPLLSAVHRNRSTGHGNIFMAFSISVSGLELRVSKLNPRVSILAHGLSIYYIRPCIQELFQHPQGLVLASLQSGYTIVLS